MYRINKSYIEKSYKDNRFDLYVNGVLYKRALNNFEVRYALLLFKNYKGIITQDLVYKSDVFLWLEV